MNRGTKCIDSIAFTPNLRKHIEGSRLFETNEIVNTDHRSYVVDTHLEECFQEEFSRLDKIERGDVDPNKRTHREKCNEHIDEMLDSIPLQSIAQNASISTASHEELEQTDQDVSFVLNKVRIKQRSRKGGFPIQKRK